MASGPKPFDADIAENSGYRYTTDAPLSSRMASARMTEAVLEIADFAGRRVIDIGCGDGTYTRELVDLGGAAEVVGVDPSEGAIEVAGRVDSEGRPTSYRHGSAEQLDWERDAFDVAHLRGVLHHVERPARALAEALRVAPLVVVVEPNGYNPGLKLLERVSSYHVEHEERSFSARRLDRWARDGGGEVTARRWIGQVPFFCPDRVARLAKRLEPLTESLPLVRSVTCGQYVFVARRPAS